MFEIRFDPAERLLHIRLEGFWSEEEFAAFAAELKATIAAAERISARFDTLSDIRDFPVQSAAVIVGINRMFADFAAVRHGRVAQIAASILSKLQAERAMSAKDARVFLTEAEARAWLAEPY